MKSRFPFIVTSTVAFLTGTSPKLKWENLYIIPFFLFQSLYAIALPCLTNHVFYKPKTYTKNFFRENYDSVL